MCISVRNVAKKLNMIRQINKMKNTIKYICMFIVSIIIITSMDRYHFNDYQCWDHETGKIFCSVYPD